MQRSGKKALFVTFVLYCAIGVSAALLRHIFHGHGCAEIKNAVSDMNSLAISIVSYKYQFGGALPKTSPSWGCLQQERRLAPSIQVMCILSLRLASMTDTSSIID